MFGQAVNDDLYYGKSCAALCRVESNNGALTRTAQMYVFIHSCTFHILCACSPISPAYSF